ncbi:MAG: DNA gyrase inhibitor YacG [Alphaproteobacteria bacterium]|nr:DNA gyrase inhibitor YacG [Alphaproteobacteria bacterium]
MGTICPICGVRSELSYHSFCSRRCAYVDLHRWLSGAYTITETDGRLDVSFNEED